MSTKQPCTPLDASQTAQILEHVEKLLALHESPGDAGDVSIETLSDFDERLTHQSSELTKSIETMGERYHHKTVELIRAVSALVEKRFEKLDEQIKDFENSLEGKLTPTDSLEPSKLTTPDDPAESSPEQIVPVVDDSASHWEKQKAVMLAKYGIDPEHRPAMEAPPKNNPDTLPEPVIDELDEVHQSINALSDTDAKAIETLKQELNSKLRDAEVELSIGRAKIIQQTSELEKRQAELDRRTTELRRKYASESGSDQKSGILDRFTRHLPSRKNPDA